MTAQQPDECSAKALHWHISCLEMKLQPYMAPLKCFHLICILNTYTVGSNQGQLSFAKPRNTRQSLCFAESGGMCTFCGARVALTSGATSQSRSTAGSSRADAGLSERTVPLGTSLILRDLQIILENLYLSRELVSVLTCLYC